MGIKEVNTGINFKEIADYVAERIKQNLSSGDLYDKWNKEDKRNKEMYRDTYTVKLRSQIVAQHMPIDMAMLLVEAMFGHWRVYRDLAITIEKESNTDWLKKAEEDK